jgi:hypothetical protein
MLEKTTMRETSPSPKGIYPTLIAAALFVFFALFLYSGGGGLWLVFFLVFPLVACWTLFQLAQAIRHADTRKNRFLRVKIWLSAFALMFGIHALQTACHRHQVNALIVKIQEFQARHGVYPQTLALIDAQGETDALEIKLGRRVIYHCEDGNPELYLVPSNGGLDLNQYDFERKIWIYELAWPT